MASVYKVVPLVADKDKALTVAMADPNNLPALDDLRNLLGVQRGQARARPRREPIDEAARARPTPARKRVDHRHHQQLESDHELWQARRPRDESIDLDDARGDGRRRPGPQAAQHGAAAGDQGPGRDIHFEPFEDEYKMRYRVDGVLYEMVPPPRHLATPSPAASRSWRTSTSPSAGCRRTAASS